jgi:hypothetical protein
MLATPSRIVGAPKVPVSLARWVRNNRMWPLVLPGVSFLGPVVYAIDVRVTAVGLNK